MCLWQLMRKLKKKNYGSGMAICCSLAWGKSRGTSDMQYLNMKKKGFQERRNGRISSGKSLTVAIVMSRIA